MQNYTEDELRQVLQLPDTATAADIETQTLSLIQQHQTDPSLVSFLEEASNVLQRTATTHPSMTIAPVAQDTLNPRLENTYTRMVMLDSHYRPEYSEASNYTALLSDPLKMTLSYSLSSFHISYTWYTYDEAYGNTAYTLSYTANEVSKEVVLSIPSGNYTSATLILALNQSLSSVIVQGSSSPFVWTSSTGIVSVDFTGCVELSSGQPISDVSCIWFKETTMNTPTARSTLGWYLGFRVPESKGTHLSGTSPLDTYGSKFFVLIIDDFNHNQINISMVGMTDADSRINMPSYASCKEVRVTAPRTLTQAQLYAATEISKRRQLGPSFRPVAPLASNMFAIIPIKRSSNTAVGDVITEFGGNLKDHVRNFFGPVDITRLHVRLMDDRGRTVDLHDGDWCIVLRVECLYKY